MLLLTYLICTCTFVSSYSEFFTLHVGFFNIKLAKLKLACALAGVAQWIDCQPVNQRVAGFIPSQGTCLCYGPGPWWWLGWGVRGERVWQVQEATAH